MNDPRPRLAAGLLACAGAGGALAQNAPPQVVEIVAPAPLPTIGLPKDQVPANVQTGKAADLERSQALDLSGFLNRRIGSIHVNEIQNNPYQADVSFRGFTASPLLGTPQGLSVYVDGVRVNRRSATSSAGT
jgi:outer membrane cobalamin receptor